jgi:Predicted metal-dependent enzyme of the double-stranded beta helix superfamily
MSLTSTASALASRRPTRPRLSGHALTISSARSAPRSGAASAGRTPRTVWPPPCARLPDPAALLSAPLRRGDPAGYQSHLLYAEPDGSFSISAMVWMPGQQTMIHDHVAWCVTGVLQGREYEEIFALPTAAGRSGSPPAT